MISVIILMNNASYNTPVRSGQVASRRGVLAPGPELPPMDAYLYPPPPVAAYPPGAAGDDAEADAKMLFHTAPSAPPRAQNAAPLPLAPLPPLTATPLATLAPRRPEDTAGGSPPPGDGSLTLTSVQVEP